MPPSSTLLPCPLSVTERDLIRRELGPRFGQQLALAAGLFLHRWRSGPQAGQPKIPAAMQGLLDRGLLEIRAAGACPRAFFTAALCRPGGLVHRRCRGNVSVSAATATRATPPGCALSDRAP